MKKKQGILRWTTHSSYSIPTVIKNIIIAYHSDDVITFIDTTNGEKKIYQAFGSSTGDGISCVAGHPTYSIFAFSELKYHPNIFVMLYPSMEKIKVLASSQTGKYIDIRFTDSEYLICLTGYPYFKIMVWNFRRGIILSEYLTGMPVETQRIIASTSPNLFAQYSTVSREINIWELSSIGDKAYLSKKNVKVSFIKYEINIKMAFNFDGNLYIIDSDGMFYMLNCTTCSFKKLWEWEDEINRDEDWDIIMYKGGFLITNNKNSMKYLKKDKTWNIVFTIPLNFAIDISRPANNYEKIFFFTSNENIKTLIDNPTESIQPYFSNVGKTGPIVKSFTIIKPYSKQAAILTNSEEVCIIDIINGNVVVKFDCKDAIYFTSFPKLPVLIIGTTDGTVKLISCYDVKNPKLITDFKLNSFPAKEITTTENYFLTYDTSKTIFIVKGKIGDAFVVEKYFQLTYEIFKWVAIEKTPTLLYLYIIQIKNDNGSLPPMILDFFKYENDEMIEKQYSLKFHPIDLLTLDNRLLITSVVSKDIYELTFSNDEETISYELWTQTCHLNKYVRFYGTENTIITWSFDGIILIYSFDTKTLNYDFIVQNRRNFWDFITVAQCTPNQKYCLIATAKGTLKCFTTKERILESTPIYKIDSYFATETKSPYRSIAGRSWIENMSYVKIQNEKIKFAGERAKIYEEFLIVKEKLNRLVDENESLEDPEDRVPLSSLNLAKEYTQLIIDKAIKNRDAEEKILRKFIADQNRITNLILSETWSNMLTKNQKMFGLATHIQCENYALSQFDINAFQNLEFTLNMHRKREISCDIWHPYLPPWQTNFGTERIRTLVAQSQEKSTTTIISEIDAESKNDFYNLSGTETYMFITPHPAQYHQLETVSFNQMFIQEFLVAFDVRELKQCFNAIFETMVKTKQDAVRYVTTRNERFREIQSEINALAVLRGDDPNYVLDLEDPQYEPQEIPESITKVEPYEVTVKPYISPSEQRLLDEIAYKEELRRLALLADDFRERALIVMMDGVLEKRWEDEIKKEVPKPDCLIKEKDPAEYTKEDLKAMADYLEKCKFIISERERYRVMLFDEEKKLQGLQDDSIYKFNLKCGELFLQKLNYDAAVKQEELKLLRTCFYNFQRLKFKEREHQINENLAEKREKVEELSTTTSEIEKKVVECQQKYEQSINRDRILEKTFKGQFAESAPSFVVDSAYKLFKRRPKWQQKAWATPTIYNELANIIANKPNSKIPLPAECYEYLNLLETNDNYSQAPSIIDQKQWEILCRLRRNKIESEFRVRAAGLLLAETEASLNIFLKETQSTKIAMSTNEKELNDLGSTYQEFIRNRSVQIVMPMGLVEVPLSGQITDFRGSLLLSRNDIADINAIIKRAGTKKLKSMQRLAVFRRKVLMKEWDHKALQMSVEDLRVFLNVIEKTVVTFEMRQWLREKAEKRVVEITNAYLTEKVGAKLAYLNKSVKEIDEKISETAKRIDEQRLENSKLDRSIKCLNVEVTSRNLSRDVLFEEKQVREQKERMAICMERSRLIRKVQSGHLQMLELATLLELQKLKTFPTLNPLMKNVCQIASNQ